MSCKFLIAKEEWSSTKVINSSCLSSPSQTVELQEAWELLKRRTTVASHRKETTRIIYWAPLPPPPKRAGVPSYGKSWTRPCCYGQTIPQNSTRWHARKLRLANFCQKLHENEKILGRRGGASRGRPPKSATEQFCPKFIFSE